MPATTTAAPTSANPLVLVKCVLSVATFILFAKFLWLAVGPTPHHRLLARQEALLLLDSEESDGGLASGERGGKGATSSDAAAVPHLLINTTLGLVKASSAAMERDGDLVRQVEARYVTAVRRAYATSPTRNRGGALPRTPREKADERAETAVNGGRVLLQQHHRALNDDDDASLAGGSGGRGGGSRQRYPLTSASALSPAFGFLERFEALAALDALLATDALPSDMGIYEGGGGAADGWAQQTRAIVDEMTRRTHLLEKHLSLATIDAQYGVLRKLWGRNFADGDNAPIYRPLFDAAHSAYHPTHEEGLRRWREFIDGGAAEEQN